MKTKKEKVSKGEKGIKQKCWNVKIDYTDGQSSYTGPIFQGYFYVVKPIDIAKALANMIGPADNMLGEEIYIQSDNEELKLQTLAAIMRKHKGYKVTTEKNCSGSNWGFNIFIDLIEKEMFEEDFLR